MLRYTLGGGGCCQFCVFLIVYFFFSQVFEPVTGSGTVGRKKKSKGYCKPGQGGRTRRRTFSLVQISCRCLRVRLLVLTWLGVQCSLQLLSFLRDVFTDAGAYCRCKVFVVDLRGTARQTFEFRFLVVVRPPNFVSYLHVESSVRRMFVCVCVYDCGVRTPRRTHGSWLLFVFGEKAWLAEHELSSRGYSHHLVFCLFFVHL